MLRTFVTIGLMGLLAACSQHAPVAVAQSDLTSLSEPKRNSFRMEEQQHFVRLSPDMRVNAQERARIREWLGDTSSDAVERITIEMPESRGGAKDKDAGLLKTLQHMGMNNGKMQVTTSPLVPSDQARLVMLVAVIEPPACPDWSSPAGTDVSNKWHSNMSCALTGNLGRMLADPRDAVRGHGVTTSDSQTGADAIDVYRASFGSSATAVSTGNSGGASGSSGSISSSSSSSSGGAAISSGSGSGGH